MKGNENSSTSLNEQGIMNINKLSLGRQIINLNAISPVHRTVPCEET